MAKAHFLYHIGHALSNLVFRTLFRLEVRGAQKVPATGGVLIAANHASFLDPPAIGCCVHRPIFYFARKTLFDDRLMGWLLPKINAIPIDQEKPDLAGIRNALRLLKQGEGLLVFPEGARTFDGRLQDGKPGVGLLVAKSGVPVVPVRIRGTFEAWPRTRKTIRLHKISVIFGDPVTNFPARDGAQGEDYYRQISRDIMDKIAAL
jgi:1-acyl-sn-glycerol-3-phosphate acyltransferase